MEYNTQLFLIPFPPPSSMVLPTQEAVCYYGIFCELSVDVSQQLLYLNMIVVLKAQGDAVLDGSPTHVL